jgi:hypothetical protein
MDPPSLNNFKLNSNSFKLGSMQNQSSQTQIFWIKIWLWRIDVRNTLPYLNFSIFEMDFEIKNQGSF